MTIITLWESENQDEWKSALKIYWSFVQTKNLELEHEMDNLNSDIVRMMDKNEWYDFLLNKYFKWKYTAPNRYATTTKWLKQYEENNELTHLYQIKEQLFNFDKNDIRIGLDIVTQIKGLGPAGASGLLSLLFPSYFGTVDQFVVKTLHNLPNLPEKEDITKKNTRELKNTQGLKINDGVILIRIMRNKSDALNSLFQTDFWTPRKIDMVLWSQR